MRKLVRREPILFGAAILAGAAFVLDRLALAPAWEARERVKCEIALKERQLGQDRQILRERTRIEHDYALLTHPAGKDRSHGMNALLGEIESLARRNGVSLIDIKPQPPHLNSSKGASVSILTESAWEPLARFIYQVYESPQLLQVERASLHRKNEDTAILQGQLLIGAAGL